MGAPSDPRTLSPGGAPTTGPRRLAHRWPALRGIRARPGPGSRWRRLERRVRAVYETLRTTALAGDTAAEWLLDNRHLVLGACAQVREDLTRSFVASLPGADREGTARIEIVARELLESQRGFVDQESVTRFITEFQKVAALRVGELWALPAFLRVHALEAIVNAAGRSVQEAQDEEPGERVSTAVLCLRSLDTVDWKSLVESLSVVDRCLRTLDPSGTYGDMDFQTRDRYRGAVEELSRWSGESELAVAQATVRACRGRGGEADHVGEVLLGPGRRRFEADLGAKPPWRARLRRATLRAAGGLYFGAIVGLTGLLTLAMLSPMAAGGLPLGLLIPITLLAVVPCSAAAVALANALATRLVPPRTLPKMDFTDGIPGGFRTCVTVPAIVADPEEVQTLLRTAEVNYLGNRDPEVRYVLLLDPPDADRETLQKDDAVRTAAVDGVAALNRRNAGGGKRPFLLLRRPRRWNPRQGRWMAWERKRGKLEEFNRLLTTGDPGDLVLEVGDVEDLRDVRFVLTLDADTRLPTGVASRLIGAMAHPLNRARWRPDGRVAWGYTVLQPRVEAQPGHPAPMFTRIFQSDEGLDLYSRAVSDVHHDLFGEGIYAGKGLYDVGAFRRAVEGRVPPDAILSHDLFEGVLGRAGLASDVTVLEDFPATPAAYMRRYHRWVRGDWQLVPWLRRRVPSGGGSRVPNPLSWLAQWKILDNLRRSLLAPALLILLLLGWTVLPGGAGWWTAWCVWLLAVPALVPVVAHTGTLVSAHTLRAPFRRRPRVRWGLGRWLVGLIFLPWEAGVVVDAVGRTLFRVFLSHRRMLEWTSASHTARALDRGSGPGTYLTEMRGPLIGIGLFLGAAGAAGTLSSPVWIPIVLGWVASPFVAHLLGRIPSDPAREAFTPEEIRELRLELRRGWAFFERYAGPDEHWLPPDHVQFDPPTGTAHRTSPTNIGLGLIGVQIAFDFGYLPPGRYVARIKAMLDSLDRLELFRGHLLNWYDTRRLVPLAPRYVSTVDSGNLAASMLAVAGGLRAFVRAPLPLGAAVAGLADDLGVAAAHQEALGLDSSAARRLAAEFRRRAESEPKGPPPFRDWHDRIVQIEMDALSALADARPPASEVAELRWWLGTAGRALATLQEEWEAHLPWVRILRDLPDGRSPVTGGGEDDLGWYRFIQALPDRPALGDLPTIHRELREALSRHGPAHAEGPHTNDSRADREVWAEALYPALERAEAESRTLIRGALECATRLEGFARRMDFRFLFEPSRKLFHIGYNADAVALDSSFYDLFASEARLASYVAIMLGQVPPEHWLMLRRPFRRVDGGAALLSWGGSMFEYLLPTLLLRTPPGSLSDQACRAAVQAQIRFADRFGIPWGVSESAYGETDEGRRYRYRAFGVPALALHRDSTPRLVVAPYAAGLAMTVVPRKALEALRRVRAAGMEGSVGYYDAADFGEPEAPRSHPRIVRTVMAHHHGMLLAGIHHVLSGGSLVRRFHDGAAAAAVEYLLHERAPGSVRVGPGPSRPRALATPPTLAPPVPPWPVSPSRFPPECTVLSNGRLSALVMANGGGGLRWEGYDVYRWRPDPTCIQWGEWGYVLDRNTGVVHSVARAPTWGPAEREEVLFGEGMVEFHRDVGPLRLRTRVLLAPSADVEVREVGVVNESSETRVVEVTSLAEVALARPSEDRRHPAFNRLFVEAEPDPRTATLWFARRSEGLDDAALCMAHRYMPVQGEWSLVGWEVDRERFLGRQGDQATPPGLWEAHPRTSPAGAWAPLDPVASLTTRVTLAPGEEAVVAFLTGVGHRRKSVARSLATLQTPGSLAVALNHSRDRHRRLRQRLRVEPREPRLFQRLTGRLAFPYAEHPSGSIPVGGGGSGQEVLWSLGVSGDRPVVMLVRGSESRGDVLRQMLRAHSYLAARNIEFDLLVIGREPDTYGEPVRGHIEAALREMGLFHRLNKTGGVFYHSSARVPGPALAQVRDASTLFLGADVESLEAVLPEDPPEDIRLPMFVAVPSSPLEPHPPDPPLVEPAGLRFPVPWGGHAPGARSYILRLDGDRPTPAPWSNVMANPEFGTLVTESGGGYTWAGNAGESRLTPFANDPILDPPGEVLYLRDEETGEIWSPTPAPAGVPPHRVTHRAEGTVFRSRCHGLDQRLRVWVPAEGAAKVWELRVTDRWNRARRLTATLYVEWVLGNRRSITAPHLRTTFHPDTGILEGYSTFVPGGHPRVGLLATDLPVHGFTCDRREFLGPAGDRSRPEGLLRVGLSGRTGAGLDPCAALQVHLDLPAGGARTVRFLLVSASDLEGGAETVHALRSPGAATRHRLALRRRWSGLLDSLRVSTPEPAMDLLLNGWLVHQALASRIWGRTGYYQSSGAFGFRDQLQDSLALLHGAPGLCRERIVDAARHQFPEGDVLHWWHPPDDRGVRTRCSDDRLWLPHVTACYLEATGDGTVLEESVPYLTGPELGPDEEERYDRYEVSGKGSLYDHCMRALERDGILSDRGLPLLGMGDWNDGLNRAGAEGRGESVWLAWFLCDVLRRFAPICRARGETTRARDLEDRAEALRASVERCAWDGRWYLRGTYDDGAPLGSARNEEGRIDSLSQSWAVLSGAGDPERIRTAMSAVWDELVDRDAGIVRLLKPPFHFTRRSPGYIKSYPPGVRENGGQYTHAATWVGWAFALLGDGDRAEEVFRLLNPILRPGGRSTDDVYRVEPYVLAGDVYGEPPHVGRGGWTWYTGSAAWLYRLGVEGILGLYPVPNGLRLQPCVPRAWPGYEVLRRVGGSRYHIRVENPDHGSGTLSSLTVDGAEITDGVIPLVDDGGDHRVVAILAPGGGGPPRPDRKVLRDSATRSGP